MPIDFSNSNDARDSGDKFPKDELRILDDPSSGEWAAPELVEKILSEQRKLVALPSPPAVEDYLNRFPALRSSKEVVLDLIYSEFLARREHAAMIDCEPPMPSEYYRRFPELSSALHDQFQLYTGLDSGLVRGDESAAQRPTDVVHDSLVGQVIGDRYEILRCLGQGGFAIVYKARDVRLRRTVAIKISRFAFEPNSKQSKRFLREAESIARLSHPGILQIYEVGELSNRPFIVGQLAEGGSLADRLQNGAVDEVTAVNWVIEICEAVEYSHQFGIIHRDLKPANILFHNQSPQIADFGLAMMAESETEITLQGDLIGTPAYMSPEQARGSFEVSSASDQYSLGVIFYQCLTGSIPFEGTASQLIHQVLHREPPPPRAKAPNVSLDLQTICLKAMAKTPEHRYSSVGEMAADLRRFQAHEPILARPIGWLGKFQRWCVRQPALAATLFASAVLLLTISWISFNRIAEERDRFRGERDRANTQLYASLISNAQNNIAAKPTGWWKNAYDALLEANSLTKTPAEIGRVRELMIKLLVDDSNRISTTEDYFQSLNTVTAIASDSDEQFVALGDESGKVELRSFDLQTVIEELTFLDGSKKGPPVSDIRILAKSNHLIALRGKRAWYWKLENESELVPKHRMAQPALVADEATALGASPDGSVLAVGVPGKVLLFNVDDHKFHASDGSHRPAPPVPDSTIDIGNTTVKSIAFSDMKPEIVLGLADSTIQVWSLEQQRQINFKKIPREPVRHVAVWQGNVVWTDSTSFTTYFWSPQTNSETKTNLLPSSVNGVSVLSRSPICTTTEGMVYMLSVGSHLGDTPTISLAAGGFGELVCTSKTNPGDSILVSYRGGRVQRWQVERSDCVQRWSSTQPLCLSPNDLLFNRSHAFNLAEDQTNIERAFSVSNPLANHLVVDEQTNDFFFFEGQDLVCRRDSSGQIQRINGLVASSVVDVAIDPKSQQLAALDASGTVTWFRLSDLSVSQSHQIPTDATSKIVAFQGQLLFKVGNQLNLLDRNGSTIPIQIPGIDDFRGIEADRDLVAIHDEKHIQILRFGDWQNQMVSLTAPAPIRYCTFSRDISTGRPSVAAIDFNDELTVWDIESSRVINRFKLSKNANSCHFDPLGKFLVVSIEDSGAESELYELASGKLIAQLEATNEFFEIRFDADGKSILVAGCGVIQIDRAEVNEAYRAVSKLQADAPPNRIDNRFNFIVPGAPSLHLWAVDASPNGKWFATVGQDRCVRIRNLPDHHITHFLTQHDDVIWSCDFSDDSRFLATGSVREGRGEVIVWSTESWKPIRSLFVGTNLISGLQFHPSLPLLAATCFDGTAWLLNYETGETIKQLLPEGPRAMDVDFTDDGNFLAIAQTSLGFSVFQIDSVQTKNDKGQVETTFQARLHRYVEDENQRLWTLSFTPNMKSLVTATQSGLIRFYSFPELKPVTTIESSGAGFRQIEMTSNSKKMVLSAWPTGKGQILDLAKLRSSLRSLNLDW